MKLVGEEKDRTKRQKLMDLQLTKDEWERVSKFLKLLSVRFFQNHVRFNLNH